VIAGAGPPGAWGYIDDAEHLADELDRLDLLIQIRLESLDREHAIERDRQDQLARTMVIRRSEVEDALDSPGRPVAGGGRPALRSELAAASSRIDSRIAAAIAAGVPLALPSLRSAFGLEDFDMQVVLICLAPELRRHYDRLYAYLQDDITRKRPSVDLILDLLCDSEPDRWRVRRRLGEAGPLRQAGLLQPVNDPYSPSGSSALAEFLHLDPGVLTYLLGDDSLHPRMTRFARLLRPNPADAPHDPDTGVDPDLEPTLLAALTRLLQSRMADSDADERPTLVHLHGPEESGRQRLALRACAQLGLPTLVVDCPSLQAADGGPAELVHLVFREARLRRGVVLLRDMDCLLSEDARPARAALAEAVERHARLVLGTGRLPWSDRSSRGRLRITTIAFAAADRDRQARTWLLRLKDHGPDAERWARELSGRYRLSAGRIDAAIRIADDRRAMRQGSTPMRLDDLREACREISRREFGGLAVRVDARYGWEDLVLPEGQTSLLQEICGQVRHQRQVHDGWGFGRRLHHGTGLSVLFSGPTGTGKTMAAQVLAGDLGLDLYTVDLSQVTSKYIGETEKNLGTIFAEAESCNAVLFFDEADALFGKRSEVSDAHDRYANLEISYLLQRMEKYAGVVVLATNLRQNLDEAFTRRIRFMVDFPFPDEEHRRRIWLGHFPAEAPVAAEVDVDLLARAFPLAGGSIKNVVLHAAFLAAANGGVIRPAHLLHGVRREFDKVGKVWTDPTPGPMPVARAGTARERR
jgi:hypothetical protein